jgi:hypothetical protein
MASAKNQPIESKPVIKACNRLDKRKKAVCQNEGIIQNVFENN